MRTLIIHHVESEWENVYFDRGSSFEEICEMFVEYLNNNYFDKVILTMFDAGWKVQNTHIITGLAEFINEVYDYGYGWSKDMINDDEDDWAEGGGHSEIVHLPLWMKDLSDEIFISGGFDGECLQDLEYALDGCGHNYTRIEELIL